MDVTSNFREYKGRNRDTFARYQFGVSTEDPNTKRANMVRDQNQAMAEHRYLQYFQDTPKYPAGVATKLGGLASGVGNMVSMYGSIKGGKDADKIVQTGNTISNFGSAIGTVGQSMDQAKAKVGKAAVGVATGNPMMVADAATSNTQTPTVGEGVIDATPSSQQNLQTPMENQGPAYQPYDPMGMGTTLMAKYGYYKKGVKTKRPKGK